MSEGHDVLRETTWATTKVYSHWTRNRNATFQFLKANKITLEMNIWRFCMH